MSKINAVKFTISLGEGPSNMVRQPKVFTSWGEANNHLTDLSYIVPIDGGYYKTDFDIIFEDGFEYRGTYDLKHMSVECPDLSKHVYNNIAFYAGLWKPSHMTNEQYHSYLATQGEQSKYNCLELLNRYDLNGYNE